MKRILVIEDCPIMRGFLKILLKKYGFDVHFKKSVEEVNEEVCPSRQYDFILSDYNLPGESGFSFLGRIRREGDMLVPLVLMSGNKLVSNECLDLASTVDAFLAKPFTPYQLDKVLTDLLGKEQLKIA
jgi:CheY-like chemotaxis protein